MKFNKITVALCCAAGISSFANAGVLKQDLRPVANENEAKAELSFADWRAEQRRAKYADTTDQVIVTLSRSSDFAIMRDAFEGGNEVTLGFGNEASTSSFVGAKASLERAQLLMTDLSQKAGMSLNFVSTLQNDKVVLKLPKEMHVNEVMAISDTLASSTFAANAEADPKRWPMAENTPWGYTAVQSSQVSTSGAGNMTVCVIDSGYDINNPDLPGNSRASGTNDSGTGNWFEAGGSHGTHVAGTIAAIGNNNQGIKGVIPDSVNLHIIKVFSASGWTYSSSLTSAISDCQTAGSKVVNMSLGGPSSSTTESNAMQNFENNGMLLVAAAGNDGDSSFSYPASYDAVVAVGAVDETLQHANFSQFTSQVELAGPGEAILSTVERGDGRQGYISYGSVSLGDDDALPQTRYEPSGSSFAVVNRNGTASGAIDTCSRSGSNYSCGNMTGKICVVERHDNQLGSNYPENIGAEACANAGAAGIVMYSNSARPGLQNPFLVDRNNAIGVPTLSVNRTNGLAMAAAAGQTATIEARANTDYAYYNGTSMASPHVAAVAALAWSANPSCTVSEVRTALQQSAQDLDNAGRDVRTGFGLAVAKDASDYMAANCGNGGGNNGGGNNGGGATALTNGTSVTGLSGAQGSEQVFTLDVPAGATDLSFNLTGGSGDADLYVTFGSEPTTSSYECRSWNSGNTEACSFTSPQAGTYYVKVHAYSAFSGASLTGSFTAPSNGGGSGSFTPISGSVNLDRTTRNNWARYTLDLAAGATELTFSISGGTGDADLYINFGSQPTTSTYECRPYRSGNNETCTISNPAAGTWHIGIRAFSTFDNVTMSYSAN